MSAQQAKDITSPCHGAPLLITTRNVGRAYMTYDEPDEIMCTADGCYNSWDATGKSDGFYRAASDAAPEEG